MVQMQRDRVQIERLESGVKSFHVRKLRSLRFRENQA